MFGDVSNRMAGEETMLAPIESCKDMADGNRNPLRTSVSPC